MPAARFALSQSLVVWAIAEGRGAAAQIDSYVMRNEPLVLPEDDSAAVAAFAANGKATNGVAANGHAANGVAGNGSASFPEGVTAAREQAAEVRGWGHDSEAYLWMGALGQRRDIGCGRDIARLRCMLVGKGLQVGFMCEPAGGSSHLTHLIQIS